MTNEDLLVSKIDGFTRKYYKNQILRGGIYSGALLLSFYLFVVILEYFGNFDWVVRSILFYAFLLSVFFILIKYIFSPLAKLYQLGKLITHEEAAIIIGRHFGEVKDKLLNVLQLKSFQRTENLQPLLEAAINQKIKELKPIPFSAAIRFSENKKHIKYFLPPLLIFIIILIASPSLIKESTTRLIKHNEYFEKKAPFEFIIENEKLQANQQEDFELRVSVSGEEIPAELFVEFEGNRFKFKPENLKSTEGRRSFRYLFKNIQKTTPFRLFADEFYSKEFELSALPNPMVLNFKVGLKYPGYVGKKDEILKNTGDLLIPEGTQVNWDFFTRNADNISIVFHQNHVGWGPDSLKQNDRDSVVKLSPFSENSFAFSSRLFHNSTYSVIAQNNFLKNKDSIRYVINVIPDLFPSIEVEEKQDSLSSKIYYFKGTAKDDYGFKKLTFNYRFLNRNSGNSPSITGLEDPAGQSNKDFAEKVVPISIDFHRESTFFQFFHVWDLSLLNIQAGDEIEYFFEIWDNDGVNGSKSASSTKNVFKAPTNEELAQNRDGKNLEIKTDIKEALKEARELQREFEKLEEKIINKKNVSWEEKKKIQDLLDKQKQLQEKMDKVKNENEKNVREQMEYREMSSKLMEKQQKLQELFEKIMTDEMKKLYEEMAKMMDKMDKNKLQEKLDEMKLSNKDIEKELDRTLELFKKMEVEQKLQENIDKLDRLAEKQNKLSENTENDKTDLEEMKKEQEKAGEDFKEFRKDLDEMEKKNKELQFPMDMENTDSQEQKIQENQQKSSEQIEGKERKKASQSQKNAAQKMEELSAQMKQMQEKMDQEAHEEDLDAMRQILENLVNLSFAQENLIDQMKAMDKNDPKYVKLGQQQKKLKDDAKLIEDSLFALSKRVPEIEPSINKEMGAINENMKITIKAFTERNTPAITSKQQYVMTSANNLALLFDEIVQQMQQNMSSKKFGNASCNKPGQGKPSPGALKNAQEKLNSQMKKMREQMEKEGNKKEPGKKGNGGMSEQLAKMAAEQEFIRNELKKMAGNNENNEGGAGINGKLDELQKLMEETETDLVNKRITMETINRQQDILIRLLESEKADREREQDEKRESREVKKENQPNPSDFFEYNRLKQKETELLRTIPPSLSPYYKMKVNEYFNSIP